MNIFGFILSTSSENDYQIKKFQAIWPRGSHEDLYVIRGYAKNSMQTRKS